MKLGLAAVLGLLTAAPTFESPPRPPETKRLYLSGLDAAAPRLWQFRVDSGRRAGVWTTIPVPSNWELHGFGHYAYGHDERSSREQALYRTSFSVPETWRGRRLVLTFEGVMTDTSASLGGVALEPRHRGGFTPFSYDVTELVRFDVENTLEVHVSERSAERSINAAERDADYWVFGGVYRPVHLQALPSAAIGNIALNARHGGALYATFETHGAPPGSRVAVRVLDLQGRALRPARGVSERPVMPIAAEAAGAASGHATLFTSYPEARSWSAENPRLYVLEVTLVGPDGIPRHLTRQRFGFRTVEVRRGERPGLYVNGDRVLLRGANRHSFWPDSGRALSRARNVEDVRALRALNLNAVRTSHYPPDQAFLEACDELGLYVIDELPGWHDAYTTAVGSRILTAMVRRDRNHPSVILWANGNEGGWNSELDSLFAQLDLQRRPVLHPDATFGDFETEHYPSWTELRDRLADPAPSAERDLPALVLPTEWLHGLYDGGAGAGLAAQWELMRASPRAAGGFLWSFADEAVVRTDRGRELDTQGNLAPDGVLGPRREETGSSAAVRHVFAPIALIEAKILTGDGGLATGLRLRVENRTASRSLDDYRFVWRLRRLPGPNSAKPYDSAAQHDSAAPHILASGTLTPPATGPGDVASLTIELPIAESHTVAPDDPLGLRVLEVDVHEPGDGFEAARWTLALPSAAAPAAFETASVTTNIVAQLGTALPPSNGVLTLSGGGLTARFDAKSGALLALVRDGTELVLDATPAELGTPPRAPTALRAVRTEGQDLLEATYPGALRTVRWTLGQDGWLRLRWELTDDGKAPASGLVLDRPRDAEGPHRLVWLGGGPFAVWENRLEGARLAVWEVRRDEQHALPWIGPQLAGIRSGVRWASLEMARGTLVLAPATEINEDETRDPDPAVPAGPFLSIEPPAPLEDPRGASAFVPSGIAVWHRIPAIGTKFHPAEATVPPRQGEPPTIRRGTLAMDWRPGSSITSATTHGTSDVARRP